MRNAENEPVDRAEGQYSVLGTPLQGLTVPCSGAYARELDFYPCIKRAAERRGWLYNRMETRDKRGMPDILVTRAHEYWLIEIKRLKKRALQRIEDDLQWQFGQLAFLKNCVRNRTRYMLIVVSSKTADALALKGAYDDEHIDYPDFVKQL